MTAISVATPRYMQESGTRTYPVNAAAHIYLGALVCAQVSDGMLVDGTAAAGLIFAGIADEQKDGGSADGDVTVRCRINGVVRLAASSPAATDVGKPVFLVDNNTVAVAPQTGNIIVGVCTNYVSASLLDVDITGFAGQQRPGRVYYGSGAFSTTDLTVSVTAGGLATVAGGIATPVIAVGSAALANGQLTFTGIAGAITVGGGNVIVNRIAGTDSGLAFSYILWGN